MEDLLIVCQQNESQKPVLSHEELQQVIEHQRGIIENLNI